MAARRNSTRAAAGQKVFISEDDQYLFAQGTHYDIYKKLGAHPSVEDGVKGMFFGVWAPNAASVHVIGTFNSWDENAAEMKKIGPGGIYTLFIPGVGENEMYKYMITTPSGEKLYKADPFADYAEMRPGTASRTYDLSGFGWGDDEWMKSRPEKDLNSEPVAIYECHIGSWMKHPDGTPDGFYTYREFADRITDYLKEMKYTHIELMGIAEHPFDGSWGYQVTGYYAPTSRYGTPKDFMYLVDRMHRNNIGVILDWVPAHFATDAHGLGRFDGQCIFEHPDPRRGENRDWGTKIFNVGKSEVKNFLIANALYWIREYHIDGLRVDAVASMLYLDYGKKDGEWVPNKYGGNKNLEAIEFFKHFNSVVCGSYPGFMTIAEESTAWPKVTGRVEDDGLGFSFKWNMGWMHDNLSYIAQNPVHRKYHHNLLTFTQIYAYTENFVLPLSHDEVVHLKRSMLDKMPGDYWQAFANLRLFYAWQYAHPGKKLLFMGGEFGQWAEWNVKRELEWGLCSFPAHDSIRHVLRDLNRLYQDLPALHHYDFDGRGFRWIDCHDSDQSVLSLLRQGEQPEDKLVILLNFTPVPRYQYRIGVPAAKCYREVLNTDSEYYGGSNCGNAGLIPVQAHPWMGFEHSVEITLPPLAALYLQACE